MAEGDGTSKNFRSAYYEKLGFCGNEEKNILDLLIASCPFDSEKLSDLCERFDLDRRCVETWKILLGVECDRKNPFDEFANVRRIRTEHFQSLKHHLEVLLRHNVVLKERLKRSSKASTTATTAVATTTSDINYNKHSKENCNKKSQQFDVKPNVFISQENGTDLREGQLKNSAFSNDEVINYESENMGTLLNGSNSKQQQAKACNLIQDIETNPGKQITLMYLIEAGRLESSDIETQLNSTYCRKLSAMALFFVNVSIDLQEAFFLFRNFTRKLEESEALEKPQVNLNKT